MRVRYTPRAFSDLQDIYRYIEERNPVAARRVVTILERIVAGLADFPETGQRSDELDVRVLFARRYPYRVYYRLLSGEVLVLHIRHVARRAPESGDI
jgi:toxin ParE1/3/4